MTCYRERCTPTLRMCGTAEVIGPLGRNIPDLCLQPVRVEACGGFLDDLTVGRLTHAGQPDLTAAVDGARKRPLGDAGAFGWDRRDGSVFMAPLVAVTLARHGAVTGGRRRTGRPPCIRNLLVDPACR